MIVCALLLNLSDTITLILFRDTVKSICGVLISAYKHGRAKKYVRFAAIGGKPSDNVQTLGVLHNKRYAGRPSLTQWLIYSVQLSAQSPELGTVERTHSAEASLGLRGADVIAIWLQTALSGRTMSNVILHRFSQNIMFVCLESGFIL